MVENIPNHIKYWEGETNHTRCFNHIVNLIAKTLLKLFEVPKAKGASTGKKEVDEAEEELERIGKELEVEDLRTQIEAFANPLTAEGIDAEEDVDDAMALLDPDEIEDFRENIVPVRLALAKVQSLSSESNSYLLPLVDQIRKLSYKIIHSTTLLLPEWKRILADLKETVSMLPRDVSTRWNSTFDMLDAAIEKRKAIDELTGEKKNKVRELELQEEEWEILGQLRDVLEVSATLAAH
jgi:hypothetical protein